MKKIDIAPYSLPNCPMNEIRFEEPRDVSEIVLTFKGGVPEDVRVSYSKNRWPDTRLENLPDTDSPCYFGWVASDDWFNGQWQDAKTTVEREGQHKQIVRFQPLSVEIEGTDEYDVTFRRSLGYRIEADSEFEIEDIEVYTSSEGVESTIRVQLHADGQTPGAQIAMEGYNCIVREIVPIEGCAVDDGIVSFESSGAVSFDLTLAHMKPSHKYCNDEGLLTFDLGEDKFTISLESLAAEGPIRFREMGVAIRDKNALTAEKPAEKNLLDLVTSKPEQCFRNAFLGQPHPHAVNTNVGCKHNRQKFWLEANADVVLMKHNVCLVPGTDTGRYKNHGDARFFFGLQDWTTQCLYPDPAPVCAYNFGFKKGDIVLRIKAIAAPLVSLEALAPDDPVVALMRLDFTNEGDAAAPAEFSIRYSQQSCRSCPSMLPRYDDPMDELSLKDGRISSVHEDSVCLRASVETTMAPTVGDRMIRFDKDLEPGGNCSLLLKVPYVALESADELNSLDGLKFDECYQAAREFWRKEGAKGAQLTTPEIRFDDLHRSHLMHVQITDSAMPDDRDLINTSVGTSTYGNFSNESCMITQELDQRGLHEEARRRLEVWLKYQGTVPQPGNFTDYDGMFFGAGGFESGAYNQHHGWVLWCMSEHLFLSGDEEWFTRHADKIIAGADWIFRQRRNTMKPLPHSRGWEHGFLPAGSLEDVTDFHYWLSTNSLTWRGTEWTARALEQIGHPEAERVRREADAYREDLRRGFDTMRQYSPLVRLRDGRWVPQFPSRLYRRGRDVGWIRQTLEGAVYLLISGLYDFNSREAEWILNDYQDNLYSKPPFGYFIEDFNQNWYNRAGFSIQPNLLAGLLPHLDRDEPEVYIWMFMNAWCSCYREQINALIEHPSPVLGYTNAAHFKTSDEANAIMWLRYMLVYANDDGLHFGKAVPRAWFAQSQPFGLRSAAHRFGQSSIEYRPGDNGAEARVTLKLRDKPARTLVRFRPSGEKTIRSAMVNGEQWPDFDPATGDVDISNLVNFGTVDIQVEI